MRNRVGSRRYPKVGVSAQAPDGKVTITQTLVVSAAGKIRTIDTIGTDDKGQPVNTRAVYEKQ